MHALARAALLILSLPAIQALAQTEAEEEQLVFAEVAGRSVQTPVSFAAAMCGQPADEVIAEFGDSIDPVCSIDEATAAGMGLVDEEGELADLTLQDFVAVELPDGETRVQMPMDFAARICGLDAAALSDDAVTERQVACELTAEQAQASNLPGLSLGQGEGETGNEGGTEATGAGG